MKILIVGAKGMLGQDLTREFSEDELVLWDREELDITNQKLVLEKVRELRPEIIINSAAYNAVDQAEIDFAIAKTVNADGPANLALAAQEINAILVHYSTDYVFSGDKREGYTEEDNPDPVSAYGFTKRLGEKFALANNEKTYILRTSRLYGKAASSADAKKSFVDTMLHLAKDRDELKVVHEEYSSPTYTPDLARRTHEVIVNHTPFGTYHAVNEGACTWHSFAREIFKLAGQKITLIPVPRTEFPCAAIRPAHSSLLNTKTPKMRSWQEALQEYLLTITNKNDIS